VEALVSAGAIDRVFADSMRAALVAEGLGADQLDARIEAAVARALERRSADRLLSRAQLAERLGITTKALQMRLARGSELASIARKVDGREVFSLADVDALLARGAR